jgi:hypothetical protein
MIGKWMIWRLFIASCTLIIQAVGLTIWWIPNRKGKFEVKSFYFILNSSVSFPFPW